MIVFLNEHALPLAGVPKHLMEKRGDELLASWRSMWRVNVTHIHNEGAIRANIIDASPEDVFAWLESVKAVAVTIEAADISCLAGRSPYSLAAADLLASNAEVQQGCDRLTITEVMDTVTKLIALTMNASNAAREQSDNWIAEFGNEPELQASLLLERDIADRAALERLQRAGFALPEEGDPSLLDAKPEAPPVDRYDDWAGVGAAKGIADPFRADFE